MRRAHILASIFLSDTQRTQRISLSFALPASSVLKFQGLSLKYADERQIVNYRKRWLLIIFWIALGFFVAGMTTLANGPTGESWVVHRPVNIADAPRGPNRLTNAGFEAGDTGWTAYGTRFIVDSAEAHSGSRSIRIPSGTLGAAIQRVNLNQSVARPIYFSGWSKAAAVTAGCRMQYSLYLDITYTDGTQAPSQYVCFSGGTHDWEYVDKVLFPQKPIASVWIWAMFQSSAPGIAWFDDLALGEFASEICNFDDTQILHQAPAERPWEGSPVLRINSGDGLSLGLSANGGVPVSLQVNGQEQLDTANLYAGGFFVRDVAAGSDYIHLGGTATQAGNTLVFVGRDEALGLAITATFSSEGDHILIDASLQDTAGMDRAISLFFALPIAPAGRTWWQDIRSSAPASSAPEHRYIVQTDWGANGAMSRYCLADLSGPAGLTLAYPMDRPAVARFAYNSVTHQFFVAYELGLTPQTLAHPGRTDVRFLLYQHDPTWGFREAFAKYVRIFPQFFTQRVTEGGTWVLHASLDNIPNIADFGIKFHSTGDSRVYARDDDRNVFTLRYLCEPWGRWLVLPSNVDHRNYDAVMAYVESMRSSPIQSERNWGNAILSSGAFDAQGRYRYDPADEPFYSHAAAFVLNADPGINIPGYWPNRGQQGWAESTKEAYRHPEWGILDGELIDSFEDRGLISNFRQEHFAFSDYPLTFDRASKRVVLPHVFSSYEFAKMVSDDVHALGKYCMANGALLRWSFEACLFDVMGSERGWLAGRQFCPEGDALLNFWRTLSYHKPYCVVQNTDLTAFNHEMVEKYFAVCAFYAIYPGFFTYNSGVTNYWERPDWYERDRDLFIKYMPKIVALNQAGWEPITHARTNNSLVYIERYGSGNSFYLTLRNMAAQEIPTVVTVDLASLGLPVADTYIAREWLTDSAVATAIAGDKLALSLTMPAESTRIVRVELTDSPVFSVAIPLVLGWNLVSLPGVPCSSRPSDLFASIKGRFDRVYTFDAANQRWCAYDDRLPYAQGLSEIASWQGLWIHATTTTTWQVRCFPQTRATIPLWPGWNLIGYPLQAIQNISEAVASLGARCRGIYSYDALDQVQPWRSYSPEVPLPLNSLLLLRPTKGYWVEVTEACNWTLQAGP